MTFEPPPPIAWYHTLQSGWNHLWFRLRQAGRWQRGPYCEPNDTKQRIFQGRRNAMDLSQREKRLLAAYPLHHFRHQSTRQRYLENLTLLEHLESLIGDDLPQTDGPLRWLDVGAKNWSYVEALYRFAEKRVQDVHLHGIELDGYRLYLDLHSRMDYARTFSRHLPNTRYQVGDVMSHHQQYDVITWFLPFVFPEPLLRWGLPLSYFHPQAMLHHVVSLLAPNGLLLLINQGEVEAEAQRSLLQALPPGALDVVETGPLPESFYPYHHRRYGWRCRNRKAIATAGIRQTSNGQQPLTH